MKSEDNKQKNRINRLLQNNSKAIIKLNKRIKFCLSGISMLKYFEYMIILIDYFFVFTELVIFLQNFFISHEQ